MTQAKPAPVGSFWVVAAKVGDRVQVVRPDGSEIVVEAFTNEGIIVMLDRPGEWTTGEHTVTAKA